MADFLAHPLVRAGLLFAAIAVVAGLGALVVARFRGSAKDDQPQASELLTKFRELHDEGQLTDQEFRNIKSSLSDKLQQELNDAGRQG